MRIAVISDLWLGMEFLPPDSGDHWESFIPQAEIPSVGYLGGFDLIVLLEAIEAPDRAVELSGVIDHLLARGKSVALLYRVRIEDGLKAVFDRLLGIGYTNIGSGVPLTATAPAWEGFFRSYGTAATYFRDDLDARSLGALISGPSESRPAAFVMPFRAGTVYTIPFHVADVEQSHTRMIGDLIEAITSDRVDVFSPEYLADLRLPGEEELLGQIAQVEQDLAARRAEAERLYRYRLLLGPSTGDPLEELVRDAVDVILERTDYRVDDRPELFAEDFWLTGPDGDFALAEVKGVNTSVGRSQINQVDNHREELDRDTAELPGLLVVNVYRKDSDLSRKIGEDIHPQIVAALRRQNVTLLRSADLYNLLARQLRDGTAGETLIGALVNGGGWLQVTEEQVNVHPGPSEQ